MSDLAAAKDAARKAGLAARKAAAAADAKAAAAGAPSAARRAAAVFLDAFPLEPGLIVAGYRPLRDELDPTPLMTALIARGARLAAPEVIAPEAPLVFRAWTPEAPMRPGAFGAEVPIGAEALTPTLVLAPLAAFDRGGARCGYGGGYYDRSLAMLRAAAPTRAIGLAFAAQEAAALPTEPTDEPLDAVVTEREFIRCAHAP
ncbi:MAG: 5-formyltetrahydrofolate cyclo-ligase [Pseudomonadota bacterium]